MPLVEETASGQAAPTEEGIVSWVISRTREWRDARDSAFMEVWGEYYRLWRGRHIATDKNRESERSRLVSPALAQALEMTVAEMEEATFGREAWVDLMDDAGDPDHSDIRGIRQRFLDDMERDGVPGAVSNAYLSGGIWGTLAAKVIVEKREVMTLKVQPDPKTGAPKAVGVPEVQVRVGAESIPPMNLIPDPEANNDDPESGLAMIHEVKKPRSWLLQHKWGRAYAASQTGSPGVSDLQQKPEFADPEDNAVTNTNGVLVTEWHGKVPRRLLTKAQGSDPKVVDKDLGDPLSVAEIGSVRPDEGGELDGDGEMVEAIVTIFDEHFLGRAIENPFLLKDRSIVTAQFEPVPNRFWGRGIMEKGYNPQKALDAELRSRMDALALIANPMMGADNTALPKGFNFQVRPGKVWVTNGAPKEALHPIAFPNLDPSTFSQSGEMERMVQIGTGAMDTATPTSTNSRNETATGTSLIMGTFVKRSKRALRHITRNFTQPLVEKILLRRIEFDEENYPPDLKFRIAGTLGIVARELEQQQMTQLLQSVEQGSNVGRTIVESIFDASSSPYKAQMMTALEQDAQPSPEEQQMQQLSMAAAQLDVNAKAADLTKKLAESKVAESTAILNLAKAQAEYHDMGVKDEEMEQKLIKLSIELEEVIEFSRQNDIAELKVVMDGINGGANNGTSGESASAN
jgi:hypothetical protein